MSAEQRALVLALTELLVAAGARSELIESAGGTLTLHDANPGLDVRVALSASRNGTSA